MEVRIVKNVIRDKFILFKIEQRKHFFKFCFLQIKIEIKFNKDLIRSVFEITFSLFVLMHFYVLLPINMMLCFLYHVDCLKGI